MKRIRMEIVLQVDDKVGTDEVVDEVDFLISDSSDNDYVIQEISAWKES